MSKFLGLILDSSYNLVDGSLKKIFADKNLSVLVTMFLVFYGGLAAPELPDLISSLFENPIFRVFILSIIVFKGNKTPQLSIMISLCYILILDKITKKKTSESFKELFNNSINTNN